MRPPGAPERSVGDDGGVARPEDALAPDLPAEGVPGDVADVPGAVPSPAETWLRIVQVHDRITRRVDSALHRRHDL